MIFILQMAKSWMNYDDTFHVEKVNVLSRGYYFHIIHATSNMGNAMLNFQILEMLYFIYICLGLVYSTTGFFSPIKKGEGVLK